MFPLLYGWSSHSKFIPQVHLLKYSCQGTLCPWYGMVNVYTCSAVEVCSWCRQGTSSLGSRGGQRYYRGMVGYICGAIVVCLWCGCGVVEVCSWCFMVHFQYSSTVQHFHFLSCGNLYAMHHKIYHYVHEVYISG